MSNKVLTEQQELVANHPSEAFVMACPGAGKTETILRRVKLLSNSHSSRKGMAVVSFTNSAVDEFKERSGKNATTPYLEYPGFIGTLDSFVRQFIFTPTGIPTQKSPHVVDSWDSLDIEIRLLGTSAYRGDGVASLDLFDNSEGTVEIDKIKFPPLKKHVQDHRVEYETAARRRRLALNALGYYSIRQSRQIALQKMEEAEFGTALGSSLSERFLEVIVDEAQDCNPEDIRVLAWLRNHGIRVTMVCDINQSIYEFRDGDKQTIVDFANSYSPENSLVIDGSFRCSPAVCALAASLRVEDQIDQSLGDAATNNIPVVLISYPSPITQNIGIRFRTYALEQGLDNDDLIILSHAGRNALLASGGSLPPNNGISKIGQVAYLVNEFWISESTNSNKKKAVERMEKMLLDLLGKRSENGSVQRAVEEHGLDARNLRRQAIEVLMNLPRNCADDEASKNAWVDSLRNIIDSFRLQLPDGVTATSFFRRQPATSNWNVCLNQAEITSEQLQHSTIHKAKGREYEGVCIVLPPDSRNKQQTSSLISEWEQNSETEPKRVVYVGVTRSKKLTAIAVPESNLASIQTILTARQVSFIVI